MEDEVLDASRKCNTAGSNCRYVAIADFSKPLNSFVTYPDKIRALCLLGNGGETEHAAAKLFSTAKYLRVLDLGDCSIQNLPSSIGHLKLLRYLNARGMKDRTIPSCITKLSKLIFFSLRGSSAVSALPDSIGEMEGLMYLDLSGCRQMGELPESFGNLKNLVHLDLSNCSQVVLGPKSLENLTLLEYLNLSGCQRLEELPRSFENLRNLVHLDLSNCSQVNGIPASLCSLTKLRHLNLSREWRHYRNRRAPLRGLPHAMENLKELRYLNLSSCLDCICNYEHFGEVRELEYYIHRFLGIISTLSNLEHLELSHNSILKTIRVSFCGLRKLHTLDFTGCSNLHKLPDNISEMDSLKFLVVKDCTRYLRRYVQNSKNLISLPYFVVHTAEGEQSSKLCLLKDVTPPELEISCLENVKSVEEARRIKLREKQSMIKMGLHWTRGKKVFVEDVDLLRELEPPSSLEEFELQGYNSVSFPAWLDTAICLPYLVKVTLAGLSQCSSLPPLGQLPKLESLELKSMSRITKIDRGFCGSSVKAFARLERLSLSDMESLEEWTMEYLISSVGVVDKFILFPNLEVLIIHECPKLRVIPWPLRVKRTWQIIDSDGVLLQRGESSPDTDRSTSAALVGCLRVESCEVPMHQWKLLHHLHSINELIITKCVDWSSSSEIIIDGRSHLGSLKKLSMLDCSLMSSLPPWLGDLTSLQTLEIMNCQRLNNLPDSMRHLSSLESLSLNGCWGIQALPDWLGDLVSLKKLDIYFCGGIMSLPESIEQLSILERLRILGCPALYNWCKLDENKMKIGHIKKVRVLLRYRPAPFPLTVVLLSSLVE
ncbi:Leucine Rich Repeat family protein, expressed [Panicum miliaceum]|uniref:Leucine Rich Repeat family protein, expressed n=1 Tax=Panicum miliaceum TaxID=4540 RepID=A0A3L6R1T5_PANMI|nr:Leucine Rich Repeat family protein, expressed [Panicum miliaceum]